MQVKYFLYLFFLVLGTVLGVFFSNFSYFKLEETISFFDLFSLIISTGVGVYIAVVISKSFTQNTTEKDLLISEIRDIIKHINKLSSCIENKRLPILVINNLFKSTNQSLSFLQKLISKSHCKNISNEVCKAKLVSLRRLVTFKSVSGNFTFDSQNGYASAKREVQALKAELYQLIFDINRK